jgi:hypothetical protein
VKARAAVAPRSGVFCLSVWLAACAARAAGAPGAPSREPPGAASAEVERFLPLRDGHVLSYRVWLGNGSTPEQVIFQVERLSPARASLRAGKNVKQLQLGADGIRLVSGGYLLAPPLELGARWMGAAGRVEVTAADLDVDVPAGHFQGCLVTTEVDDESRPPRSIVSTYCPDVGIARIEVDDGEREQRFELLSFGPRVDINAL